MKINNLEWLENKFELLNKKKEHEYGENQMDLLSTIKYEEDQYGLIFRGVENL